MADEDIGGDDINSIKYSSHLGRFIGDLQLLSLDDSLSLNSFSLPILKQAQFTPIVY